MPFRRFDLVTMARGHRSATVRARYGYDLSSRYRTLNRGRCSWIRLYSRWRASTSPEATIHSTRPAASSMASVLGCWGRPQYAARRLRRDLAFPTYMTRPSPSRKRYAPGASGTEAGSGLGMSVTARPFPIVGRHQPVARVSG